MATKDETEALAALYMVDHRHGEERHYMLRLTPTHLTLVPVDEEGNVRQEAHQGFGTRLLRQLRREKGVRDPYPLLETDFRLDDTGVRIRLGQLNASFSFHDFDREKGGKFLMAYLGAKGAIK